MNGELVLEGESVKTAASSRFPLLADDDIIIIIIIIIIVLINNKDMNG